MAHTWPLQESEHKLNEVVEAALGRVALAKWSPFAVIRSRRDGCRL
ncbi:MAG: hypothetical protein WEB58_19010 [Planctomycetaceae bacterium]